MSELVITEELITTSGALSVFHAALDELARRYGGSDEATHLQFDEVSPPLGFFLVGRIDQHLAGGVGIRPISDPDVHFGEVKRLWVRPDHRRTGLGSQLMSAAEERARELGYKQLYLETGYAQPEAVALYESSGWERIAQFPEGVWSYPQAFRFTKSL